ncbi:MAG: hypothetical protein JNK14_03750 [Chitinophagaceae bacterium]|nr:hypothetical protein [Chitinophagaceae bacterium]
MKKIACLLITALLLITTINAQTKKWKELDEFHTVMSETFHPAEEGKLGPIKSRSQEMVDKATAWVRSDAPEGFDKKAVNPLLKKLLKGTKKLNGLVKNNASDKEITDQLTIVHDVFHQVEEKCEKKESH